MVVSTARRGRVLSNFFSVINRRYKCRLRCYPLYHLLGLPALPRPSLPFLRQTLGRRTILFLFPSFPYDRNGVTVKIIFPMIRGYLYRGSGGNKSGARSNFSDTGVSKRFPDFLGGGKETLRDVLVPSETSLPRGITRRWYRRKRNII